MVIPSKTGLKRVIVWLFNWRFRSASILWPNTHCVDLAWVLMRLSSSLIVPHSIIYCICPWSQTLFAELKLLRLSCKIEFINRPIHLILIATLLLRGLMYSRTSFIHWHHWSFVADFVLLEFTPLFTWHFIFTDHGFSLTWPWISILILIKAH